MKKFRRILSALLAVVMIAGAVTAVGAANLSFTDVSGHWAWTGGQIPYLVDKGVLNGYQQPNGTYMFKPDGEITRAEFIKILDETFGLTATVPTNFKDVAESDWFQPYFAKAAAQGYILNYGSYANPNGKITREEALSLLVRYLDLPANEKSSTSYFADYNSISDNFKDYVLRGVYAGLTDGYNENGVKNFKPQKTLSRAEALTILYRAAGCIFNTNAYSRDNSAPADNNVITKPDVTVRGVNLTGRTIVSEGANGGTVTLSDCTLNGTLYVRGNVDIVFDDCDIADVVMLGGGTLSLLNDTVVDEVTVLVPTTVKIFDDTTVENLIVETGSNNTKVTGDGLLGSVVINARGFTSSMFPNEFEIGNNLTAVFANEEYSGSTATQNSFTITPFVTADSANAYINVLSDVDGELYYYYTNSVNPPSVGNFDSYYESSSAAGHFSVEAGLGTAEATIPLSTAEKYDNVMIQIKDGTRKYAPIVIANSTVSGTGFSTDPYLDGDDKVKFQTKDGGIVFCYYTNSGTGITQLDFLEEYMETEAALKKEASVNSIKTYSIELNENYLENYDFVAFMLKAPTGQYYTPVIIGMGETGFTVDPTVTEPGKVAFKTKVTGEVYYYYSETAAVPGAADFKTAYNRAEYGDTVDVKKNVASSIEYSTRYIDEYPYLILCVRDGNEYLQPVAVNIDYSTGFSTDPELRSSTEVRFKAEESGTVYYYYASFTEKNPTAPKTEDFRAAYKAARYRDKVDCGRSAETIDISASIALKYPYMVFMFMDDDGEQYTPVLLSLNANQTTGFTTSPSVMYYNKDYFMSFKTADDGEVWYFYDDTDDNMPTPSEFEDDWKDMGGETASVTGGKTTTIELDRSELKKYPVVIIAFYDEDSGEFSYPIAIDTDTAAKENSGSGLTGISVGSKYVSAEALFDGRLYWYHTDEDSLPDADEVYDEYYREADSDIKDYSGVSAGGVVTDIEIDDDYDYLVLFLRIEGDDDYEYLEPVLIDLEEKTTTEDSVDDGSNKSAYSASLVGKPDYRNQEFTVTANKSGKMTVAFYIGGEFAGYINDGKNVTEGREYDFEYDENDIGILGILGSGAIEIRVQVTDGDDIYKALVIPVEELN